MLICLAGCVEARPERTPNNNRNNPLQQDRVPGEYIVTTMGDCAEACVRTLATEFSISEIEKISVDSYRIKLGKDPGLEILSQKLMASKRIKAVQPNFRYRMN